MGSGDVASSTAVIVPQASLSKGESDSVCYKDGKAIFVVVETLLSLVTDDGARRELDEYLTSTKSEQKSQQVCGHCSRLPVVGVPRLLVRRIAT